MYDLKIIKQNGGCYIDSREVAEVIEKRHDHLLRDIRNYTEIIERRGLPKVGASDFFIESSFVNSQNKSMPCYLLSKMGCELVANKLTGEKGVLFTAIYVSKFNEMEAAEHAAQPALIPPRLGEYNAAARLIVRAMLNTGASSERIIGFLRGVYEPLGISIAEYETTAGASQMHTAKQIAEMLGVYTQSSNPHYLAIDAILNEFIEISDEHKSVETMDYGDHIGVSVRYDNFAVNEVRRFIDGHDYPEKIYTKRCVYHIKYDDEYGFGA